LLLSGELVKSVLLNGIGFQRKANQPRKPEPRESVAGQITDFAILGPVDRNRNLDRNPNFTSLWGNGADGGSSLWRPLLAISGHTSFKSNTSKHLFSAKPVLPVKTYVVTQFFTKNSE
jgi:hypothetical protein